MKAIQISRTGGAEVLDYVDLPMPEPAAGEVLVKAEAIGMNYFDTMIRTGRYRWMPKLPFVLGNEMSGHVAALGPGVRGLKVGQKVFIAGYEIGNRGGLYAEYVAVPAGNAFKLPDNIAYADGSVITRHFPMAFNQLTSKADVKPGEWVLVMGATGALGNCCVQVAKMLGAKVIAGAGADERVELAKSYGADFGINYRKQDLLEEVLSLTGDQGVDVVCENISDPTLWARAFNSLAINGRMVTAGAHGGGTVTLDMKRLYMRRLRIIGTAGTNVPDVYKALDAAGQGRIRAIIDRIMPLREAAAAHRIVEKNQISGKIILDPMAS